MWIETEMNFILSPIMSAIKNSSEIQSKANTENKEQRNRNKFRLTLNV